MTVLQALDRYYDRMAARGEVTNPGYSVEPIGIVLLLSEAGQLIDVHVVTDPSGKNQKAERVPKWFWRQGNGSTPYFLWDNTAYALGVSKKNAAKTVRDHAGFKALHLQELQNEQDIGLRALRRFIEVWTPDLFVPPLFDPKMLDWNVAFRLLDEHRLIHDRPAAAAHIERLRAAKTSAEKVFCLVTGRLAPPVRLHPKIKGVDGTASSEVPLVSFNEQAFESYGKRQGFNAPTSEDAAFRYGAALNSLLDKGGSRNRMKIADATIAFWADASNSGDGAVQAAEEHFSSWFDPPAVETGPRRSSEDAGEAAKLRDILEQIAAGRPLKEADPRLDEGVRLHVLGLAPNIGRLVIRYWVEDRFEAFAEHLVMHYRDLNIEPKPWISGLPSMQRLLLQTMVPPKVKIPFEYIDKNLAQVTAELMRAILTGGRYPRTLLSNAILRLRAGDNRGAGWHAAAIKAYINREYRIVHPKAKEALSVSLDPENPSSAYQLGRLFAVLESAQYAALDRVKSSIADRYYGAASSTPARVFGSLIRGARNHISDANKRGKGFWIDPKLTEIIGRLPANLPTTLKMEDQGRFAVGYYHERGSRPARKDNSSEIVESTQAEKEAPDAAY